MRPNYLDEDPYKSVQRGDSWQDRYILLSPRLIPILVSFPVLTGFLIVCNDERIILSVYSLIMLFFVAIQIKYLQCSIEYLIIEFILGNRRIIPWQDIYEITIYESTGGVSVCKIRYRKDNKSGKISFYIAFPTARKRNKKHDLLIKTIIENASLTEKEWFPLRWKYFKSM